MDLMSFLTEQQEGMSSVPHKIKKPRRIVRRDAVVESAVSKFPDRWGEDPTACVLVRSIVDALSDEIDRILEETL